MPDSLEKVLREKQDLRLSMSSHREPQQEADSLSRRIWNKMPGLPQFACAAWLCRIQISVPKYTPACMYPKCGKWENKRLFFIAKRTKFNCLT